MTPSRLLLLAPLLLAACASNQGAAGRLESRGRYLMGTTLTVSLPAALGVDAHAAAAFDEVARIEALVSTWRADSELSKLNRAEEGTAVPLSPEVATLLTEATGIEAATGGAFSPSAGRLIELWDLRREGRVPAAGEIRAAALAIAEGGVRIDSGKSTAARISAVAVEEGGFAKGYALDRAIAVLRARGVRKGILDFGGQVALFGFDQPVGIDIADPEERSRPAVRIEVMDASISTSSGSEKWFENDGVRYSHLVDPRTGVALPPSGSATAFHEDAMAADAYSTALYVLGPRDGLKLADREGIAAIWLVPENDGWIVVRSAAASALPLVIHPDFKARESTE